MKSKILICLIVIVLLSYSCIAIDMVKHPDYNYIPTNPASVIIYDQGLIPQREFFIIGKMTIDSTLSLGERQTAKNIRSKAALIGGDAVIITDKDVSIYAFNRGTTTEGTAWGTGSWLQYRQTTHDNTLYIPQVLLYGYVIKFKAHSVPLTVTAKVIENTGMNISIEFSDSSILKLKKIEYLDFPFAKGDMVVLVIFDSLDMFLSDGTRTIGCVIDH